MNTKRTIGFFSVFVVFGALVGLGVVSVNYVTVNAGNELKIHVKPHAFEFRLGETAEIQISVTNDSDDVILLAKNTSLRISREEAKDFRLYAPTTPDFVLDGIDLPVELQPGATFVWKKSVLWNDKPRVLHLNADAAKRSSAGRMLSDYAFPESGSYLIKAGVELLNRDLRVIGSIESEPTEIVISEPEGKDLGFWRRMKADPNIGYVMQNGDIPRTLRHKDKERDDLLKEIDSVLMEYPDSVYSITLRKSRDNFRFKEAERQQSLKTLLGPKN